MFVTSFSVSSRHNERPSQPFVVLFEARFWRHPAVLEQSVAPVRRLHERSSRQFCVRPQRSERLSVSLFGGLVPRRSPGALPVAESRLDHPRRALHETSPESPTWRLRPCSSAPQARRPCILELRPFWICSRFSLNSCLLIRMPRSWEFLLIRRRQTTISQRVSLRKYWRTGRRRNVWVCCRVLGR